MAIKAGIFGDGSNVKDRFVQNKTKLKKLVRHWKELGLKIVLTSGTWDLFHIGHAQYFEKAKELGDLLIVGVDSDEKVRTRKGPSRPVVPEGERVQILSHVRHVDIITLKQLNEKPNELIKIIRPDVLVMSKTTGHSKADLAEKKKYVGKIVILEPQATTSTSAKVRLMHVTGAGEFAQELVPELTLLLEKKLHEGSRELAKAVAAEIPGVMEKTLKLLNISKNKR